jgi:hypothetical protein
MPRFFPCLLHLLMEPVENLSSSSCTSCDSHSCIAPESDKICDRCDARLGTINSIGITSSYPYTNLNGVCPVNFLLVVLYAHNTIGILKSQSSLPTLQIFFIAFSRTLLNASIVPFACGWYDMLFWWWIWNYSIKDAIVLLRSVSLDHSSTF